MFKRREKRASEPKAWRRSWFGGRKAAIQPVKDATNLPVPPDPRAEAVAVLKQGVKAWNAWVAEKRKADPKFRADLRGVDFRQPEWCETPLWRQVGEDLGIYLYDGDVLGRTFEPIDLSATNLEGANLEKVDLRYSNLKRANLAQANLTGAYIGLSNLEDANLDRVRLNGASLRGSRIHGTRFSMANFSNTNVRVIDYAFYKGWPLDLFPFNQGFWPLKKNLMLGCYLGVRGLDGSFGDPGFIRDALDQNFIDDKYDDVRLRSIRDIERIPARLVFALWGFFDYGRSIISLLIFASIIVIGMGYWYQGLEASHAISYGGHVAEIKPDAGFLYQARPWFAALMGFATLGLTDIIAPHNWKGAFAMVLNVIAGFSTLGLFIAVFQNKFARRS